MTLGIVFKSPSPQAQAASIAVATEAAGMVRLTATSRTSEFCSAMEPAVRASQQLKLRPDNMSSDTVAVTKSQLLSDINMILNSFQSVRVQLRSAPANVQNSFKWDVLADGRVKTAVGQATTKRQIRAAVGEIVGSHPNKEGPFITYILAQCERPAPWDTWATQ
jgi:hypothetical protein